MHRIIKVQPSSKEESAAIITQLLKSESLSDFVSTFTNYPSWEKIPEDTKEDFIHEYHDLLMNLLCSQSKSQLGVNWGNSEETFLYTVNDIKRTVLSANKIKSLFKGYLQRKSFYNILLQSLNNKDREKKPNSYVMKAIMQSVSMRKLTLEQCFRAADTDSDGNVTRVELKVFLENLQLSIPTSYITRFLLLVDEDCSGIVTSTEFYRTLVAFQIEQEPHSNSGRALQQEALAKFTDILNKREIGADEMFNLCDIDMSGRITLVELEKYINILNIDFKQKEIAALMNLLDNNNNGEITREEFFEYIETGNKVLFEQEMIKGTETIAGNNSSPSFLISKFEAGKNTLFDLLDQCSENTSQDDIRKIMKSLAQGINDNEINTILKEINKTLQAFYLKSQLEEFCICYSDSNMLTKEQYIKKIELILRRSALTLDLIVKKEGIKGVIEKEALSQILKRYLCFNQNQVSRFFTLMEINSFVTIESFGAMLNPVNSVQIFTKILQENNLSLVDFYQLADKKQTGKISSSVFELTAALELKNIDGRLLTDLVLMFPMPKIDKATFFRLFQCEIPISVAPNSSQNPRLTPSKIEAVSNLSIIQAQPVRRSQESEPKRRGTLFLIGSDHGGDFFKKFLANCDKNIPTHTYFEKYGVFLHQLCSLEKFYSIAAIFRISRLEADDVFKALDTDRLGYIYAYSLILMLDSLRNVVEALPTQDNYLASPESQALMQKLVGKYSPKEPLYKSFPPLGKIVDWPSTWQGDLNAGELERIKQVFPSPCYYYHLCAVLQTYQKIEYLCGEQVLAVVIERNKINDQAAEHFSDIACDSKNSRVVFVSRLLRHCSKLEAESSYQFVYGDEENKPAYNFFAIFDCVQTSFRNKMQRAPVLPTKNSSKTDESITEFLKKLGSSMNKPLISYKFSLLDENTEIGFSQAFERQLKIPRSESLQHLKLFKLSNDHKIRLYHIMYVLDSYNDQAVSSYASYYSRIIREQLTYGVSFLYSHGMFLRQQIPVVSLQGAFNFFSETDLKVFATKIDNNGRGYVFGYEIAAEIDKLEGESKELDQEAESILKEVSEKVNSKFLDCEENALKEMVNFERFFGLISQHVNRSEATIIWNSLKPPAQNKIAFYSYLACLAKYTHFIESDVHDDIRIIGLMIPENIATSDCLFEFQLQVLYQLEEILSKFMEKFKMDKTLVIKFLKLVDTRASGKIFGFELLTWVDLLRSCANNGKIVRDILQFPFNSNPATAKSLQQSLKIIASELDFNNKATYSQYKSLESLKVITMNNLITTFQEIPESNIRELYLSMSILPGGLLFYHIMAVIESYRVKRIEEVVEDPIISARNSARANIQEAKLKLKAYLLGDNPKKRQLTCKEVFGIFDKNSDGVISSEEFMSCLDMIHLNLTANEKIILTREVDRNRDDKIVYDEIMNFVNDTSPPAAEILGLENSLSSFKDGSLDQAIYKLKLYIQNNQSGINSLEKVFERLDEDKSGGLNDTEFNISLERLKLSFNPQQKNGLKQLSSLSSTGEILYKSFCTTICEYKFGLKPLQVPGKSLAEDPIAPLSRVFDYKLSSKDFFTKSIKDCTSILNSEEAALKRCSELFAGAKRFLDPDFGPEKGKKGDVCLYWDGVPPGSNYPPANELSWKSPSEWLQNVGFFKGGISSNDVIQGSLGDCWFIGALSVLAQRDELVRGSIDCLTSEAQVTQENALGISKGVYPPLFHSLAKKGMYVFRFFIDCGWRWVIIDDRIPVFDAEDCEPQFVFGHCKDPGELWVSLIEKAYAKVYGCYEALNGGLIDDALVDLTGFVAENTKINCENPEQTEKLWTALKMYRESHCLMGCSIDAEGVESDVIRNGEVTGLLARHAYAIIDIIQIPDPAAPKKRHRLVRLRNPWGQREWTGKWADGSPEVAKHLEKLQGELRKIGSDEEYNPADNNDGSFLMCFKDWRDIYHNLYACVDFSDEWWGVRFEKEWNPSNSGGVPTTANRQDALNWAKNPQFVLELKSKTQIFVSLSQQDGRYVKKSVFPFDGPIKTACFTIMKLESNEESARFFDSNKIVKLSVLKLHRNIELRAELVPGKYCIVPATIKPGQTGEFWLSVYFNCGKNAVDMYCAADKTKGIPIEEEEEYTIDRLTPRLMSGIKDLVHNITSFK